MCGTQVRSTSRASDFFFSKLVVSPVYHVFTFPFSAAVEERSVARAVLHASSLMFYRLPDCPSMQCTVPHIICVLECERRLGLAIQPREVTQGLHEG